MRPIPIPINNRLALVDRENISGLVGGIDFGSKLSCLARSSQVALFWSAGTMYWSGRATQSYSASHLIGYYRSTGGQRLDWTRIGDEGGKLNAQRIIDNKDKIAELFGDPGLVEHLVKAVRDRNTILVEGGGAPFVERRR